MSIVQNIAHAQVVADWEAKNARNLSSVQRVQLFEKAIKAIESRTCETLSRVTMSAILDRVLHLSLEKFPVLSEASVESLTLNFEKIHLKKNFRADEMIEAQRFLLIELLSVLSRITANILAEPLHKELSGVAWQDPEGK